MCVCVCWGKKQRRRKESKVCSGAAVNCDKHCTDKSKREKPRILNSRFFKNKINKNGIK